MRTLASTVHTTICTPVSSLTTRTKSRASRLNSMNLTGKLTRKTPSVFAPTTSIVMTTLPKTHQLAHVV
jgi:hypothetical protein